MLDGHDIGKLEETAKALKVRSFVVSGNVTPSLMSSPSSRKRSWNSAS